MEIKYFSILQDCEYVNLINRLIDNTFHSNHFINGDLRLLWDIFKIHVRENTLQYCRFKAKLNREHLWDLEKELRGKYELKDSDSDNISLDRNINELEIEIANIYEQGDWGTN